MKLKYDRLITFDSTHHALLLESKLDTKHIEFDIRPIPPALSAGCGLAIEFFSSNIVEVLEAIQEQQIVCKAIYQIEDKLYVEMAGGIDP